ncbi:MAG: hypothetical protein J3R72DRAFT_441360 [Linnemannia gamsii]|nr:MAG: hypothetical protein J3R72DRAFT_441360 [Linnemannia gamsii]
MGPGVAYAAFCMCVNIFVLVCFHDSRLFILEGRSVVSFDVCLSTMDTAGGCSKYQVARRGWLGFLDRVGYWMHAARCCLPQRERERER